MKYSNRTNGDPFTDRYPYAFSAVFSLACYVIGLILFLQGSAYAQTRTFQFSELPQPPFLSLFIGNSGSGEAYELGFNSTDSVLWVKVRIRVSRSLTENEKLLLDLSQSWLAENCPDGAVVSLEPGEEEFELYIPACAGSVPGSGRLALLGLDGSSGLPFPEFQIVGGSVMVENVDILKQESTIAEPRLENCWKSGDQLRFQLAAPGTGNLAVYDLQGRVWASMRVNGKARGQISLDGIGSGIYFLRWENDECPGTKKLLVLN